MGNGILSWFQIILSIILIIIILLQKSDSGIGGAFGSGNDSGITFNNRRGFEKFAFNLTIVIALLLIASLILPLILN
ncbi:MAG: preprotein translocase subunit SecG [Bacteroidetes bacterium]|nr:preprotein translocase subunit SecG [Bacteroidota bacterium]